MVELAEVPIQVTRKVERSPRSERTYAEVAKERLQLPAIKAASEVNARDPEFLYAKGKLADSLSRATTEQKAAVEGISALGEEAWVDIQAQVRNPATKDTFMDGIHHATVEESEALKRMEVVESDVFFIGDGVQTTIAATAIRQHHPDAGIVSVGEGSAFHASPHDAWQLNTSSLTPYDTEYEEGRFKANRDMNHLPGLPVQPREMDARLNPGNASVRDSVEIARFLATQVEKGAVPEGSIKVSEDPRFRYELRVKDTKTGKITLRRFNVMGAAAGFGETDYSKIGDQATQDLIRSEVAKTSAFLKYLVDGTLPEGANAVPGPGKVVLGVEQAYEMFGRDPKDPLQDFRDKDIVVLGAGGHTGLTMLMNLASVGNSSPGFGLDPHGNGKIYALGLKTPTRNDYLHVDDLPVYKPLADALPVEPGKENAYITPVTGRASALRETEDGKKVQVSYKDPNTGQERVITADMVIVTSGMKPSLDLKALFADIPGFREGTTNFAPIEGGNMTQRLGEHDLYLFGSTASEVTPKKVTPREHQLLPGFKEGAASPVMVRTVLDTQRAAEMIADTMNASKLVGPVKLETRQEEVQVTEFITDSRSQQEQALFVPENYLKGTHHPFSNASVAYAAAMGLGNLRFPPEGQNQVSLVVKQLPGQSGMEVIPNFGCENAAVAGLVEGFCGNPIIQQWLRPETTGDKSAVITMPIQNGMIVPGGIQLLASN